MISDVAPDIKSRGGVRRMNNDVHSDTAVGKHNQNSIGEHSSPRTRHATADSNFEREITRWVIIAQLLQSFMICVFPFLLPVITPTGWTDDLVRGAGIWVIWVAQDRSVWKREGGLCPAEDVYYIILYLWRYYNRRHCIFAHACTSAHSLNTLTYLLLYKQNKW